MQPRTIVSLLLTAVITATTAGCRSAMTRDSVPPEPDVKPTEQLQPPVKITAREAAPTTIDRG
jgi:hypothetical protein